ncbi:MAG: methyltransferase domain-containing protein [Clostridia bacterium]|nr:methyltransferase domain-containing protein [Clostridia bacterium]
MNEIEKYYNKFNEDKRLTSRHGIVEFTVTMENIKKYIPKKHCKIIDIGAGTGRYSNELSNLGHDVVAVELVQKNLSVLKQNYPNIKAIKANALNLSKFKDDEFDVALLFGPMYHLFNNEDKLKALSEAKRVVKNGGVIFVAYLLSDYAFIRHAIMDNYLSQDIKNGKIDKEFNILTTQSDLYSYVRLPQIDELNSSANLKRKTIFAPDGATDYIRPYINALTEEDFKTYINYQLKNCERCDLIGASSHVVDVLIK